MRKHNPNPVQNVGTYDPSISQNGQNIEQKKSNFVPGILIGLVCVIGLGFLFSSLRNFGTQQYQERCTQGVSSTGEKIMNCITYNNGISTHTSFPYIFWLNSRGSNYTNNNGVYERVWSVKNSYTTSNTNSTTTKSTLGSSGKTSTTSTS